MMSRHTRPATHPPASPPSDRPDGPRTRAPRTEDHHGSAAPLREERPHHQLPSRAPDRRPDTSAPREREPRTNGTPTALGLGGDLPRIPAIQEAQSETHQSAPDARMTKPILWRLTHSPSVADVADAGKMLLKSNNVHINYQLQEIAEGVVRDAILAIAGTSTTAELRSKLQPLKDELSELLEPKNRDYFEGKVVAGVRSAEATLGRQGHWDKSQIVMAFMLYSK